MAGRPPDRAPPAQPDPARPVCRRAQPLPGGCRGRRTRGVGRAGPDRGRDRRVADDLGGRGPCGRRDRERRGPDPPGRPQRDPRAATAPSSRRPPSTPRPRPVANGHGAPWPRSTRPSTPSSRWCTRSSGTSGPLRCFPWHVSPSVHARSSRRPSARPHVIARRSAPCSGRGAGRGRRAGTRSTQRSRGVRRRPVLAASGAGAERERARVDALAAETASLTAVVDEGERARLTRTADREATRRRAGPGARPRRTTRAEDSTAVQTTRLALAAAREVEELTRRLGDARSSVDAATQVAQDLREAHLDLRERRISGMAAELAGRLAVGGSCPVCGSVSTPPPPMTRATSAAPTRRRPGRATSPPTSSDRHARSWSPPSSPSSREPARAARTGTPPTGNASTRARVDTLEHSTAAEARSPCSRTSWTASTRRHAPRRRRRRARACGSPSTPSNATRPPVGAPSSTPSATALLADHPGLSTVTALVRRLTRSVSTLEAGHAALLTLSRSRDRARASHEAAQALALEAGFDSLQAALDAVLSEEELSAGTAELASRRSARVAAEAVLADETVSLALRAPLRTCRRPCPGRGGLTPAGRGARDARAARRPDETARHPRRRARTLDGCLGAGP